MDVWITNPGTPNALLNVRCKVMSPRTAMAVPVDPRMTHADIEGATKIFPNADNTGWLFAHAEASHHHERELAAEGLVSELFEDLLSDRLTGTLKTIVNDKQRNQQIAALSNYTHLISFRKDALNYVRHSERALHIGKHIQEPDDLYLHHQAKLAISETKRHWQAEKAQEWNAVSHSVDQVIGRLTSLHAYETRWDMAARIAAEAEAAAGDTSIEDS